MPEPAPVTERTFRSSRPIAAPPRSRVRVLAPGCLGRPLYTIACDGPATTRPSGDERSGERWTTRHAGFVRGARARAPAGSGHAPGAGDRRHQLWLHRSASRRSTATRRGGGRQRSPAGGGAGRRMPGRVHDARVRRGRPEGRQGVHRQGPVAAGPRARIALVADRRATRAAPGRADADEAVRLGLLRHAAVGDARLGALRHARS